MRTELAYSKRKELREDPRKEERLERQVLLT